MSTQIPWDCPLTYLGQLAKKEEMMNPEVDETMRRGLIIWQIADGEGLHLRNEVYAALHSQEAGFHPPAQSCVPQTTER